MNRTDVFWNYIYRKTFWKNILSYLQFLSPRMKYFKTLLINFFKSFVFPYSINLIHVHVCSTVWSLGLAQQELHIPIDLPTLKKYFTLEENLMQKTVNDKLFVSISFNFLSVSLMVFSICSLLYAKYQVYMLCRYVPPSLFRPVSINYPFPDKGLTICKLYKFLVDFLTV